MEEDKRKPGRPKAATSLAEKEMDKAEKQFDEFDQNLKDLTLDRMNQAPKMEQATQTKLSNEHIRKSTDVYLKPDKTIGCRDKFNEKFRDVYNFDKEYVQFIAENKEIIGEMIEIWTRPYGGMPAEFWKVPVNKPVWGPRYLAEQIKSRRYHRFVMNEKTIVGSDGSGTYHGSMVVDNIIQRLDANPIATKRSVFMGVNNF